MGPAIPRGEKIQFVALFDPPKLQRVNPLPNELFVLNQRNAIIGCVAWVVLFLVPLSDSFEGDLIQRILLLGVLIIVPLGLALVTSISQSRSSFFKWAVLLHRYAAVAVIVSGLLDAGFVAAALASLWLLVTGLIGLDGLIGLYRLRHSELPTVVNVSLYAGMRSTCPSELFGWSCRGWEFSHSDSATRSYFLRPCTFTSPVSPRQCSPR